VVQRKPRKETAEISYKNPRIEVMMDKNCRSKGQTMDFSKRRCLSGLHNSNSSSKKELI